MASLNPYLNFPGNTEEAFNFYKSVFGGEFLMVQRFKDTPEASRIPAHEADKLMHISLPIGNGNILMGTDALESMGHSISFGTNFSLAFGADSETHADHIFEKLSEGGHVTIRMSKQFWGAYFGMVTDKFGVSWMVDYTPQP